MRIMLFCLLVLDSPINAVTPVASKEPNLGPWEVLEGCRFIKSPVNDGDSFKLVHEDRTFIIRLYYVDCPETYDTYRDRLKDQARYFSISESEVIASGKVAKAYTRNFLKGEFTVITRWEDARGGENMRYFGIVRKQNRLLSTELVRDGLARIYGMPTKGSWPGGFKPEIYLKQLKQSERNAQQAGKGIWGSAQNSAQLAGLRQTGNRTNALQTTTSGSAFANNSRTGKLILNTASASDLEALPGIGPALSERIIAARPFQKVDELAEIPGISIKKVDAFRDWVLVDEPPPPPMTVNFYLAESETYLNKEVVVNVSMITQSKLKAPDGFRSICLETSNLGEPGGSIHTFVPDEYFDSFINYYRQPNREFRGLLFQQDENIVLVYRRK